MYDCVETKWWENVLAVVAIGVLQFGFIIVLVLPWTH